MTNELRNGFALNVVFDHFKRHNISRSSSLLPLQIFKKMCIFKISQVNVNIYAHKLYRKSQILPSFFRCFLIGKKQKINKNETSAHHHFDVNETFKWIFLF